MYALRRDASNASAQSKMAFGNPFRSCMMTDSRASFQETPQKKPPAKGTKRGSDGSCQEEGRKDRQGAKNEYLMNYTSRGKIKKRAWICEHLDSVHYGKGLCYRCYHLEYYRKRSKT